MSFYLSSQFLTFCFDWEWDKRRARKCTVIRKGSRRALPCDVMWCDRRFYMRAKPQQGQVENFIKSNKNDFRAEWFSLWGFIIQAWRFWKLYSCLIMSSLITLIFSLENPRFHKRLLPALNFILAMNVRRIFCLFCNMHSDVVLHPAFHFSSTKS